MMPLIAYGRGGWRLKTSLQRKTATSVLFRVSGTVASEQRCTRWEIVPRGKERGPALWKTAMEVEAECRERKRHRMLMMIMVTVLTMVKVSGMNGMAAKTRMRKGWRREGEQKLVWKKPLHDDP